MHYMFVYSSDNWDPTTKNSIIKTNNGINEVQTCFKYMAAQIVQFLLRERHEIITTIQLGKLQV